MAFYKEITKIMEIQSHFEISVYPLEYKGLKKAYKIIKEETKLQNEDTDTTIFLACQKSLSLFYKFTDFIGDTKDLEDTLLSLKDLLDKSQSRYPTSYEKLFQAYEILENKIKEPGNRLIDLFLDKFTSLYDAEKSFVLVAPASQKKYARQELLNLDKTLDDSKIPIFTDGELIKSDRVFDFGFKIGNLINISPLRNSRLLSSSRIHHLMLFHYEVFSNDIKHFEVFDQTASENIILSKPPKINVFDVIRDDTDEELKDSEELIALETKDLAEELQKVTDSDVASVIPLIQSTEISKEVESYVFETMSGKKIFWDEEEKIDSIESIFFTNELFDSQELDLESVLPEELESGDCILYFARGGKEYLDNVAKGIEPKYIEYKLSVLEWKENLRNFVSKEGLDYLENQMTGYSNLIHRVPAWMDDDQGGPGKEDDFYLLMDLIGQSAKKFEYWSDLVQWRNTRVNAGKQVSSNIKNSITIEDISKISKELFMTFSLEEFDGAEVHAYLLEDSRKYKKIPYSKLRQPY